MRPLNVKPKPEEEGTKQRSDAYGSRKTTTGQGDDPTKYRQNAKVIVEARGGCGSRRARHDGAEAWMNSCKTESPGGGTKAKRDEVANE